MKKKILYSLMALSLVFVMQGVSKAASVLEPQWAEFCPPLYENAVFKHAKENSKRNMENNYWALRKVKFEKSIAECKAISKSAEDLGVCFSRVASLERNKNKQRSDANYEKRQNENTQMRDGRYWWY